MASYQAHGALSGHDPNSCPEILRQIQAHNRAVGALNAHNQIAVPARGTTRYLAVEARDLPSSAEMMSSLQQVDSDTFFDDELTAQKYREVLLPDRQQQDGTIPQAPLERKAHVKALYTAFKCVPSTCVCKDGIKRPFVNQTHDNYLVECLCWDILRACIQRSEKLGNLVEAWEPSKFKYKTDNWSFAERFDHIVQTMAKSKTICKHLFDVKYLYKIVDDPVSNNTRVDANRKLNGVKARVMKRGKEAEEDDRKDSKRVKTDDGDSEQGKSTLTPVKAQPHYHQQPSSAPAIFQQPPVTPYRPQTMMQPSTPTNFSSIHRYQQSALPQSAPTHSSFPNPGNMYDSTPSRLISSHPNMAMAGVLGAGQGLMTPRPFSQAMHMQHPWTQQNRAGGMPPPMFDPAGYAYGSHFGRQQQQPGYGPGPMSTASSGHTDALSPNDASPSGTWLMQPRSEVAQVDRTPSRQDQWNHDESRDQADDNSEEWDYDRSLYQERDRMATEEAYDAEEPSYANNGSNDNISDTTHDAEEYENQ